MNTKTCIKCGETKELDQFSKRKDKGIVSYRNECRACERQRKADHYQKRPLSYALRMAKQRAIKKGMEFNLTEEDLVVPEYCPLLGIPLQTNKKGAGNDSPSIDRIDSSKGYTKDNVWIISHRANTLKNNATIEELSILVRNLHKKVGGDIL